MIKKISDNVWKVNADGNVYLLEKEATIIDTGNRANRYLLEQFLSKVLDFSLVKKVIFTHLHYDHIGNFDLFPNATFYASLEEIEDFRKDPFGTVLKKDILQKFLDAKIDLRPVQECGLDDIEIISTPGHTRGSICIFYRKTVLFSGDTLFGSCIGRTDLPTSEPQKMQSTLNMLVGFNHKILAPGHDY